MKLTREQRTALAVRIADRRAVLEMNDVLIGTVAGVHPSQVGRICRGDFRTLSGNVVQICKVLGVGVEPIQIQSPCADDGWGRLEAAVLSTWDRTPDGADDLARVIEALAPLTRSGRRSRS